MVALAGVRGDLHLAQRAFISATERIRPARTEPWQAMVAATWSSRSLGRGVVVGGEFVGEVGDQARDVASPRIAGVARTRTARARTLELQAHLGQLGGPRLEPVAGGLVQFDHFGKEQRLAATPPSAIARRIRSSTSRSCAACWSTMMRPSSASATI